MPSPKQLAKALAYRGEIRNTSRNRLLGGVADVLSPVSEFADQYKISDRIPFLGGMSAADLTGLKGAQSLVNDMSYGKSPISGASLQTTKVDPRVLDLAGVSGAMMPVGKALGKAALREGARQIETGTGIGRAALDPRSPITTWHGSPHTFPPTANNPLGEFDPMKVGTGEGAQAYGVGAGYLAEAPAVAKGYRQTEGMYKRVTGGMTNKEEFIADHLSQGRPETSILDLYAQKYGGSFDDAMKDLINVKQMYGTGNLYKVDLPDEHVAKMLDWDKPLSEQHPSVQSALAKLDPDIYHPKGDEYSPDEVGAEIYLRMANSPLAKNQSDASEVMRNAGITGIRYLDAASRDAGKGTSNFVVFDPKHMNILERNPKYAKGGKVASAGGDWLAKKLVQYGNVEGIGMSKGGLPKTAANWVAKKLVQYQEQARPLSKAEGIEAGLYHPIGGSKKLVRPVSEMTSTKVPNTPMVPRKIISPEDLYGSYIVPALGDRTAAGSLLTHVGETKLDIPVQLLGGPDFMRSHAPYNSAWAVHKGAATGLLKQIRGEAGGRDVYMPNVAMAHTPSGDFSTMMTDTLLGQIGNSKITKKSIKEFDNNVKAVRPEFKGLLHPETRDMLNANGALRHAFVHEVGLTPNFNAGFPDLATTRVALTVPELIDVPLHSSGFTIAKLDPAGRIVTDPASPVHPSYNTQLAGQYVGGFAAQPPRSVMFPTFYNARRAAGLPESGDIRSFQTGHPGQVANQEWLDSVMNWMEKNPKVK